MNSGISRSITVNRRLRPIRLAFLVETKDKTTLRKIIQINTCLWGGRFNAIIPAYRKAPRTWGDRYSRAPSAKQILSGYIDAFEPDFVVTPSTGYKYKPEFPAARILSLKDLLDPTADDPVGYGIDVIELFSHLYEKEFQFHRRHPSEAVLTKSKDRQMSLFNALCFGEFPTNKKLEYLKKGYVDIFDAKEITLENDNLFQFFKVGKLTPLRLASDAISIQDRGWSQPSLFYMDGTSSLDLIDYWNLRAAGYRILPLPIQWAPHLVNDCVQFINKNHIPYRHNQEMMQRTTMICSRSSDFEDMQHFVNGIQGITNGALSCQHWYPRIWDEWARDKDHVVRANVNYDESSIDVQAIDNHISFPDLSPQFAERFAGRNTPRWVNVIHLSDYSHPPDFASVIPPETPNLDRILDIIPRSSVWSNSEGIVMPSKRVDCTHRWRIPTSSKVFAEWMGEQGFKFKISSPGNIAFQIVRSLGGSWGLASIANEEILNLLNKMASGTTEHVNTWLGLLKKINGNRAEIAQRRLDHLLKRRVLQIGLSIQCPNCTQHTWYSLKEVCEDLLCEKCLQVHKFPAVSPPTKNWHYRAIGPFSVKDYALGSYCVCLVLRFFSHSLHSETSWMPSFCLRGKESELESDFGFFWQQSTYKRANPTLVLGECKTYDRFEKRDTDRARQLAEAFPGSVIAFCTLRKQIEEPERKRIAALAKKGRRYWKAGRWRNPVLVLTGTELFHDFGPPSCWEDAGGMLKAFAATYRGYDGIQDLCDATQQLHLGMESYSDWLHQKRETKKQQRQARAKKST